jgi:hypothetical protein
MLCFQGSCTMQTIQEILYVCQLMWRRGVQIKFQAFYIRRGDNWSAFRSARFAPGTHCMRDSIGLNDLRPATEAQLLGPETFVSVNEVNLYKLNSVASVRERTNRPTDRCMSAKLVPTFADRGCHVVSLTDPYCRILVFLDRSRYFIFKVAPQLYLRGWVGSVPNPLLPGIELWPLDHRGDRSNFIWIFLIVLLCRLSLIDFYRTNFPNCFSVCLDERLVNMFRWYHVPVFWNFLLCEPQMFSFS